MKPSNSKATAAALLSSLVCCLGTAIAASPSSINVNYQNYEHNQRYTQNMLANDVGDVERFGNIGDGNQRIRNFPENSSFRRLRIDFKNGEFGSQNLTAIRVRLRPNNRYTLKYSFRFLSEWDFGLGGKVPGISGGSGPAGGRPTVDGMSHRIMWRQDARDNNGTVRTYLESYHYWLGQFRRYEAGDSRSRHGDRTYLVPARRNQWYDIGMQVRLDSGQERGRLIVTVNGVTRYNRQHTYYTRNANWQMNQLMHVFFYGGGSTDWAPSRDTRLMFDNLNVTQSNL